jgi:hypothetical protein
MAKQKDFPTEHYNQLSQRNKELIEKVERLALENIEKEKQIQERDEFIQKQNFALIREQNNVSKLSETTSDVQSKGASLLKRASDALKSIADNE